jgi:hypothetical protein
VAALFDRVSSEDDPVFPTPAWPPMRFDRPLCVGAVGGHGSVRYSVVEYEPGVRARFRFAPPADGYHELSLQPWGTDRCRVRHVLVQHPGLAGWWAWMVAGRWAHDVVIEEVLDNFERAATRSPRDPTRWPLWLRILYRLRTERPVAVNIPQDARLIGRAFERVDFSDAWQMTLRPGVTRDLEAWCWPLGLPVVARTDHELMLGEDAAHLDFRVSVHVDQDRVTISTIARAHDPLGRLVLAVVRIGHPWAVRRLMRRRYRRLALEAPSAGERAWAAGPGPQEVRGVDR